MAASRSGKRLQSAAASFKETAAAILLHPVAFFSSLPAELGLVEPALYFLVCASTNTFLTALSFVSIVCAFADRSNPITAADCLILMGVLVAGGLILSIAGAFCVSFLTFIWLKIMGAGARCKQTIAVLCLCWTTLLLSWTPVIGLLAAVYTVYLASVGLSSVLKTSRVKAALAFLLASATTSAATFALGAVLGLAALIHELRLPIISTIHEQKSHSQEASLAGYFFTPPAGYSKEVERTSAGGGKMAAWRGPARDDGTTAAWGVSINAVPAGQSLPADQVSKEAARSLAYDFCRGMGIEDVYFMRDRRPSANGFQFAITRWRGRLPGDRERERRGICAVTSDGQAIIVVSSADFMPHADESVAEAEQAALSLHTRK